MVHRDIKPSNIMLDRHGKVKLLDFGLVQLQYDSQAQVELTGVGQCLGTIDYMPPEQVDKSSEVDHRSDLYSLGVTFYRLLTGRFPLGTDDSHSVLQKLALLQRNETTAIQKWLPELPDDLATFITNMLAKDLANVPRMRPRSLNSWYRSVWMPICAV